MESTGHHSKARSQDNPRYPERFPVPVYKIDWQEPFAEYQPRDWTADVVAANSRELKTGHQWAVRLFHTHALTHAHTHTPTRLL